MSNLYRQICEKEVQQTKINPNQKSAYKELSEKIREVCTKFENELSAVKTHFKKVPKAKSAKAKSQPRRSTKEEEEP